MFVRAGALSHRERDDGAGWCSLPRGERMFVRAGALSHRERDDGAGWYSVLNSYKKSGHLAAFFADINADK